MVSQFSKVSVNFTKKKTKKFLKENGIFFTPKFHRDELLNRIRPFIRDGIRILEPSVGSGEFVRDLVSRHGTAALHIDAVELNEELFKHVTTLDGCNAIHDDFITRPFVSRERYDIILGNPPYFELGKKSEYYAAPPRRRARASLPAEWRGGVPCNRRTNIFSLFILKSIALLKQGGVLAFIIPPSWMNGTYYEGVRAELSRRGTVLHLDDFSATSTFMKTRQDTMLLVFQKGAPGEDPYKLTLNRKIFYSFQKNAILDLMRDSTTIKRLQASVRTGPCVWNQMKDKLTDDPSKGVPLIYSGNIQGGRIVLQGGMARGKKQYVVPNKNQLFQHSSIVINRGFGKGKGYSLKFALCRLPKYTCENHTNVIVAPTEEVLHLIYKSLCHPKTEKWCSLFIGNGQLSKTEIEEYLPIFSP